MEDFDKYIEFGVCHIKESIKVNTDILCYYMDFKLHVDGDIIAPNSIIDIDEIKSTGLIQAYEMRSFNCICKDLICEDTAEFCNAMILNIVEAKKIICSDTLKINNSNAKKHILNTLEFINKDMFEFENFLKTL